MVDIKIIFGGDCNGARLFHGNKNVHWRLGNSGFVVNVQSGVYREWMVKQYEGAAA
jgi:hypothetical protein